MWSAEGCIADEGMAAAIVVAGDVVCAEMILLQKKLAEVLELIEKREE
jgi:hypothetical protein